MLSRIADALARALAAIVVFGGIAYFVNSTLHPFDLTAETKRGVIIGVLGSVLVRTLFVLVSEGLDAARNYSEREFKNDVAATIAMIVFLAIFY